MESFTVDLSDLPHPEGSLDEHSFYDPIIKRLEGALDHQTRVNQRVAELIKPDTIYRVINTEDEDLGTIGNAPYLNVDDAVMEGDYSIENCTSEEELAEYLFKLDVVEAVLNRITHPNDEVNDRPPLQTEREWIAEEREQADRVRREITEDEALDRVDHQSCNGSFDRGRGEIDHTPGVWCPIHLMN